MTIGFTCVHAQLPYEVKSTLHPYPSGRWKDVPKVTVRTGPLTPGSRAHAPNNGAILILALPLPKAELLNV